MTPVSLIMTTESYKISLVTTNLQTSFESRIRSQDYASIQGLLMNNITFADWVTLWVVHLLERTETDWPNYPHQT